MVAAAEEVSLQASLLEEQKSLAEMMLKETAEQAARREASAQAKLELMGKSKEEVEQKLDLERKRRKKASGRSHPEATPAGCNL